LLDNVATTDANVVRRLNQAGMVLLGKTNTVQFAFGAPGVNHHHGTPHNPWHATPHVLGGSSNGSGVAVGAGLVPMALGTDTGGSVRIPAALCGTVGLKTTVGQVSRAGVFPLSWTFDSVGPLARCVEDAAMVYQAMRGPDPLDVSTGGTALCANGAVWLYQPGFAHWADDLYKGL
jgi:aspartyl-tRNA(Asn)/glutamyl-tRNA(Gln) amidotransferase subunit A